MSDYLDFGIPISFGWTSRYLDHKTQTRREWKDSHAAKFCNAYDRAAAAGQQLRVPAIDKGYHCDDQQIGWCIFTMRPYKEALSAMGFHDLNAEGGMCASVEEFTQKYFGGDGAVEVWVINFVFIPLFDCGIEFVPALERPFYAAAATRVAKDIEADLGDENADEVKTQVENSVCDHHRDNKVSAPLFEPDPEPENLPLPPHLIVTGRRIVPYLKKKILGALALHSHCLGVKQKIDIHTLFYETKLFGYRYNYKSQTWDLDWNKPKKEKGLKNYE